MAVLVILDSRHKDVFHHAIQSKEDCSLLPLALNSREWAMHDYRFDQSSHSSLSFGDFAFDSESFESIFVDTEPDAVGDALTRRIAQALQLSNGRLQRLHSLKSGFTIDKPSAGDRAWQHNAVWETVAEIDRRIDAFLRKLLPSSAPFIAGSAVLAVLALLREQEPIAAEQFAASPEIVLTLSGGKSRMTGRLVSVNGRAPSLPHPEYFKALMFDLRQQRFIVEKVQQDETVLLPPPPFHLGSLMAAAETQFDWPPEQTLALALALYELFDSQGNHLITYPVTASTVIPEAERLMWRELIFTDYGKEYVPLQGLQKDEKSFLQGAVRPSSPRLTPKAVRRRLSEEQYQLYSLIWQRTAASFMTGQKISVTRVTLAGGSNRRYVVQAESHCVTHRGYTAVLPLPDKAKMRSISGEIRAGQEFTLLSAEQETLSPIQKTISLGQIAEELISKGFCLPEQLYILPQVLTAWKLTESREGSLCLSEVGCRMIEQLDRYCPQLLNPVFLSQLMGKIAASSWKDSSSASLLNQIDKLLNSSGGTETARADKQSLHNGDTAAFFGYCPECAGELTIRKGKFGRFVACSSFPKCRYTRPLGIGVKCPADGCRGEIIERAGKTGEIFYGCSEYPACRFTSRYKPVNAACPKCGNPYLLLVSAEVHYCPQCKEKFPKVVQ